jgi:hypothetical protein
MKTSLQGFFKEPDFLLSKPTKKITISKRTYESLQKMLRENEAAEEYESVEQYAEEILATWVDYNRDIP